jgi:mRNA interferase RelE/StbE
MPWRLSIDRRAIKDLEKLPAGERRAVEQAISALAPDPASSRLHKLAGSRNAWRLRVGNWRVRLELDNASGTIHVLRVLRRNEGTYRD